MKSSSKKIVSGLIGLFIIGLFILLLSILNSFNSDEFYTNKVHKSNHYTMNYPYFKNKSINNFISNYIKEVESEPIDELNYEINFVSDVYSILFIKSNDGKIVDYDSFIFDSDGNKQDISFIISDENILKERVKIYLDNSNIVVDNYSETHADYQITKEGLGVIITSNENNADIFNKVLINYNEIEDI